MKARYWAWMLLNALWLPIGPASAVGMGDLTIRSSLGSPLVAEINVLASDPNQIDGLWVGLASDLDFSRAGIERDNVLDQITFRPAIRNDGSVMIEVASQIPISDSYLHFLVTLKWADGQIVREYTLLLDRPINGDITPAKIIGPEIPTAEFIAKLNGNQPSRDRQISRVTAGSPYGPVQRREFLIGVGNRLDLPSDISIYQRLYAIFRDNRHAFIHENMNLLRAGVVLDIPTAEQMAAVSRVLAMETFIRQVAEWQEYRLKIGILAKDTAAWDEESPELSVMKATMVELEAEIVRLRQQLEEASLQEGQPVIEPTEAVQYQEELTYDIRRLEAARDQLIETIGRLSDSSEFVAQTESIGRVDISSQSPVVSMTDLEQTTQEAESTPKASGDSDKNTPIQENILKMEATLLSRNLESQKLKDRVLLLEQQIQKAVALLVVKDEALALAQQEAAVYGAALEALETTSNEQQETLIQEDSDVGTQKVEASVTPPDVIDDAETVPVQAGEIDDSFLNTLSDRSNRPALLIVGAALLLLFLFLTIRRKRFQGERGGAEQMSRTIEAAPQMAGFMGDSDVASKLDLARAYVDTGDHEAARELLFEISAQGDSDQKAEAKRLNDMLGS